jgi:hypothetical protein
MEITFIFRQNRRTIACDELIAGFDALYSVHYVLRLNCSYLGVYTTNSLQREGNYGHFLFKSTNGRILRVVCWYRHFIQRALCFAVKLQLFRHLYDELSPTGRKLRPFLSKSTNGRILRAVGPVSTLNTAGAMFCALHAVIRTFKRRTATNGKEITVIFCPNRRMVLICELLDWLRRLIERALCSARKMQ